MKAKSIKIFALASVIIGLGYGVSTAFASTIVTNGGFETGDFTGWTRTGNTTDDGVNSGSAHSGNYGAFFVPVGSLEYLSQNLPTVTGTTYNLSFFLFDDVAQLNGDMFQLYWNGALIYQIPPGANPNSSYQEFDFNGLAATGGITELKFAFQSQQNGGWITDDISVVENGVAGVPENMSSLWVALPLVGMFAARRFSRKC